MKHFKNTQINIWFLPNSDFEELSLKKEKAKQNPAPTTTESNVLYVKLPESHPVIMDSDVMQPPEQPQAPPQLTIGK